MFIRRMKWAEVILTAIIGAVVSNSINAVPVLVKSVLPVESGDAESVAAYLSKAQDNKPGPPLPRDAQEYIHECHFDGRSGEFRAIFLSKEYNWEFQSDSVVKMNDQEVNFRSILNEPGFQHRLQRSRELVAIGTASCEGTQAVEELRAERRSIQLCAWLKRATPQTDGEPLKLFHRLNLGQFNDSDCNSREERRTLSQRQLLIILVMHRDPDLDLEACLEMSLSEREHSSYLTQQYSQFNLIPASSF